MITTLNLSDLKVDYIKIITNYLIDSQLNFQVHFSHKGVSVYINGIIAIYADNNNIYVSDLLIELVNQKGILK